MIQIVSSVSEGDVSTSEYDVWLLDFESSSVAMLNICKVETSLRDPEEEPIYISRSESDPLMHVTNELSEV